ncbi:hypothetical protein vseg_008125 [Gypsophila vaccaria]
MATLKVQRKKRPEVQKPLIISDNNLSLQPQYGVNLMILNQTSSELKLDRVFTWSGAPTNPGFPATIPVGGQIVTTYIRGLDDGSIAAVVYTGSRTGSDAYSYVLAWDAPAKNNTSTPNKVYVNCAPKSVIDGYTFEHIRTYLKASGEESHAQDILTRTIAQANISDSNPNIATVGACLSVFD